jgi:hypothetical protein
MTLAIGRLQALQGALGIPVASRAELSILIEKTCDSSPEAGECFFCTGPETD